MLLGIFSSCAKDSSSFSEDSIASRPASTLVADVDPSLIVQFNPDPGIINQPVTVTGTFNTSTGVPVPDCGKLHLFQKVNGDWVSVTQQVTVTTTQKSVSYTFTPTMAGTGAYEFKVNYVKAGCADFNTTASGSFFLDVIEPCNGLTLEGAATGVPSIDAPGMYDFTVNYTVTACNINYDFLKLQGGLTSSSTLVGATSGHTWEVGNGPNPNSIIKWTETAALPGGSKTYTATFRKAYTGSGPMQITGNWSVKASLNGVETAVAEFPEIIFNK